ncbi:hypothetical protein HZS_2733 [Henneguya salminicola]|uniref:14-3-3 protein beta/alpha (Trinotate prediction) n=1 Tax=Henneguya salminicola TaxID=69463 RepID=A0A6G3MH13_HENSL|nr:hypothetical protein HZS_2733 [Henneguya salminicola]
MALCNQDRTYLVNYAKICADAELYEDMAEAMTHRCKLSEELNDEERNLLSNAFKNLVSRLRSSYRIICTLESKNQEDPIKLAIIRVLKEKVYKQIGVDCNKLIELLEYNLLPNTTSDESKVFLKKLEADYYRYRCEVASGEERDALAKKTLELYIEGTELVKELPNSNPIRLGLALNFSVFYYEIKEDPQKACSIAKTAFDEAIDELNNQNEDSPTMTIKDSTLIMQLLRDNLTLWTSDNANQDEVER